jgi:hypothetical protein
VSTRWSALAFLGAALAGLLLRGGAALAAVLWFDEGTAGLMGRRTLAGELLVYFHGQVFMGAVDGYLHAIPFAVLGSSPGTLRLVPLGLSLLHVALCALLARRIAGDGRWAAVLALIPAPILVKFAHDARLNYGLVPTLTLLLLLLGLRSVDRGATAAARTRALLVAGVVAGLAWWTNLIHTIPIAAAAGVILLRRPRLRPAALAVPLAFAVGSAPFWLFGAVHGYFGAVRTPLADPVAVPEQARLLLTNALPLLVGLPQRALAGPARPWLVGAALILLAAALGACLSRGAGGWLVASVVGLGSAAVVLAEHGRHLGLGEPIYLLPVLAVLPVALGVLLALIARRHRLAAGCLGLAVIGAHVAGLVAAYPWLSSPRAWPALRERGRALHATVERLVSDGATAVYTHDPEPTVLTFASRERIAVSHVYQERYPPLAARVDGARQVVYLAVSPPPGFDESLTAAGVTWTVQPAPTGWRLYSGFRLEHDGHREIAPARWTASASHQPALAQHVLDRDARTHWNPRVSQDAGVWIQLDLGGLHDVGMVAWLPRTFQEVPPGIRVELSADGQDWTLAREIPRYYGPLYWSGGHPVGRVRWGRVELRFPPRRARHVRVTQLGANPRFAWTIRELFVYETGGAPSGGPDADPDAARLHLERAGVRRVLGDHAVANRLVEASGGALDAPAGNLHDLHGTMRPPGLLPPVAPEPDLGIAFPSGLPSATAIETALGLGGLAFATEDAGGYRLLTHLARKPLAGARLAREGWRLAGSPGSGDPQPAVDGRPDTRWTTGRPQRPGDWLRVDLPAVTTLVGVDLELGTFSTDYPRGTFVEVRGEDGTWARVATELTLLGPLVWAGTHVLRDGVMRVALRFPPSRARAVRVVLTDGDPAFDWSVAELHLLGP